MVNPTSGWDKVPVYGVWMEIDDLTPKAGEIVFTITDRIVRTDGTRIYPKGGQIKRKIGELKPEDQAVHDTVRQQLRDAAALLPGFNGPAWDAAWASGAAGRVFVQFPAKDDLDVVQTNWQVKVEEKLNDGSGQIYYIEPKLTLLPTGLSLGTIIVPPGSPTAPAPVYAKGVAGGVASLDSTGKVPLLQLPGGIGGGLPADADLDDIADSATRKTVTPEEKTRIATSAQVSDLALKADLTTLATKADTSALTTKADLVSGKIPTSQIPAIAIHDYLGAVSTQTAMLSLVGQRGDYCTRTDGANVGEWRLVSDDPTQLGSWIRLTSGASGVTSVQGQAGVIVLTAEDLAEGSTKKFLTVAERAKIAGAVTSADAMIFSRQYSNGGYPVRGTLPAGAVVIWYGPVAPTIGGNYAVNGVDKWTNEPA